MTRRYDTSVFGDDFEFELTPDVLAYEMSMDFSNQVIKRCNELGITCSTLAKTLGISVSTLSEKLSGQNLTLKSMASIALALDCDASAPTLIPERDETSMLIDDSVLFDVPIKAAVDWSNSADMKSRNILSVDFMTPYTYTSSSKVQVA